ncbi:MAG: SDR family NAD(P)-dependent oxidoreductase [Scytonematopsis contorta HA4267-MV1]|jgi:short-subunit dehydrogenase|nr:SDR family NAD(P)-dependent oxidoreductase [Scytonematopsis contorta HA4267-MV1]
MSENVCVVVGVGLGLGLAIAEIFGQHGYSIAMLARREQALAEYQKTLKSSNIESSGFSVDVADEASIIAAFNQIKQKMGTPQVLIYNTASPRQSKGMATSNTQLVEDFKINVAGALTCVQQVAPLMKAQGKGTILLTGGGFALSPYPDFTSLSIGKAGIRSLSLSLAQELRDDNIHVATVTVCGTIGQGEHFLPSKIAQVYWELHNQEQSTWQQEYVYK